MSASIKWMSGKRYSWTANAHRCISSIHSCSSSLTADFQYYLICFSSSSFALKKKKNSAKTTERVDLLPTAPLAIRAKLEYPALRTGDSTSKRGRSASSHPHNFPEGHRLLHPSHQLDHHSCEVKRGWRAHARSPPTPKTKAASLPAHHGRPSEVKEKRANENSNEVCVRARLPKSGRGY